MECWKACANGTGSESARNGILSDLHKGCAAGVSINAWCVQVSETGVKVHPFQPCETWSFRAKRTLRQTKLDEAVTWRFI